MSGQPTSEHAQAAARLVVSLSACQSLDEVGAELLKSVRELVGATDVALLRKDGGDGLTLVWGTPVSEDRRVLIGDVRSRLWGVLMGHGAVRWEQSSEAPDPFGGTPEFDRGMVTTVTTRGDDPMLLALGGMTSLGTEEIEAATLLGMVVGPVVESLLLLHSSDHTHALLRHVTDLAAQLPLASSPKELLDTLVRGLTALEVVDAAVVFSLSDEGELDVVARSQGYDESVLDRAGWRRVQRTLDPTTGPVLEAVLSKSGPIGGGSHMTLLALQSHRRRVLGLIHHTHIDEDSRSVFTTLAGSIGPALRQVEMAQERRSLVATFGRVLRPPEPPEGCDIGVQHHPNTRAAESFGGDFYDWFLPDPSRLVLAVGDVSGKGIPAAASSSMAVWSLRALGRQGAAPGTIARLLDKAVAQELSQDRFVTLALADVDLETWQLRLVLAGHPAPLLLGANDDGGHQRVDRPLGVFPEGPAFTTSQLKLQPGEAIVLFTDGITDAVGPKGERFGRARLVESAEGHFKDPFVTADDLAGSLWETVLSWSGGAPDDDCAIIVLRRP